MKVSLQAAAVLALSIALGFAPGVAANQWNERTTLTFSEPIMVPGATLQPGSYVFRLVNSESNRHLVQILKEGSAEVVALTQAVPTRRDDPKGDVVLKVNPTEPGTPPAIQALFYPGSTYGHRFVYPEKQARDIAQRTRTLVLSSDVAGSDVSQGTLHTYDASGVRGEWTEDTQLAREWEQWRKGSASTAAADVHEPAGRPEANAPMMQADRTAMKVRVDELEEHGRKYLGKTVSVDAEVEEVLGPRVFTIDEPNWGDLDGEILVVMPTTLIALLQDDDRVTVTGTIKEFVRTDLENEWGWFDLTPDLVTKISLKPVLVADRIVGGNNNVAMVIQRRPESAASKEAVGTAGTAASTGSAKHAEPVASVADLAGKSRAVVGRRVVLEGVKVTDRAKDGRGFWVRSADGTRIFVLPSEEMPGLAAPAAVSLEGVVLQMPHKMRDRLSPGGMWNDEIYVYATHVSK